MGLFNNNKEKIRELEQEIRELKRDFDKIEQDFKRLRGLINRKVGYESDEKIEKSKYSDPFDFVRGKDGFGVS